MATIVNNKSKEASKLMFHCFFLKLQKVTVIAQFYKWYDELAR